MARHIKETPAQTQLFGAAFMLVSSNSIQVHVRIGGYGSQSDLRGGRRKLNGEIIRDMRTE
ncbi:hypothetical protein DWU89_15430 [Parabacteroides acidifaciens]|uniref:Uncharacterized protein n=1 Tax=Parabacteroides acidifaciens TaxID=2290935 RepID=A0A3D8HB62_9BACT|nr:hypothetical protein DWU89_15430 [Parabacteroides acidifaciens]